MRLVSKGPLSAVAAAILLLGGAAAGSTAGCKRDDAGRDLAGSSSKTTGVAPASARLRPAQGDLATLLAAEITQAHSKNLRPYVKLRADWCDDCKEIEASMSDPRMIDAFAGTYIIVLDVDDWGDKLKPFGLDASSIPVFFEVDDGGKATGRKINGGAWAKNVPVRMAPPLKAFFAKNKK